MMEWLQSSEELTMNEMKLGDVSLRWVVGRALGTFWWKEL
jgi:hypothetical protein